MKTEVSTETKKFTVPSLISDGEIIILLNKKIKEGQYQGIVLHIIKDSGNNYFIGETIGIENRFFSLWNGVLKISNY